ncbi:DUF6461 domain-containing protein [Paractinoplanes lichenicola]|uniref:Uncharacterized protein n=1 Tax=Paractinoplanes lichenicola TaxID=2802976 RepID=A0ABS1VXY0_9ACTN|nr:DUF6461 domain-containing protein [Actinoplanes lichenicola]MBL7259319.1 hypothetical protein [Actinoplanes lichenicola]
MLPEVVEALSRGTETVTLYASEHEDPRFLWVRDGAELVEFASQEGVPNT